MKTTAIITGASQGIGAELAQVLSGGYDALVLIARSASNLNQVAKQIQEGRVYCLSGDLREDTIYQELAELVQTEKLKPKAVVHNAGYLVNAAVADLNLEEFRAMYEVNVTAYFRLVKTLMPLFGEKEKCHWVVSGSMGGVGGSSKFPGLTGYSSSKGAALILNEVFAAEYAETGHRFNTLSLGSAQTEMLEKAFPGYEAPVSAQEMAEFMGWFIQHGGRYMNGKNVPVALTTP